MGTEKLCRICQTPLKLNNKRDIERKVYCSRSCLAKGRNADNGQSTFIVNESRKCACCGVEFLAVMARQKYCSKTCQGNELSRLFRQRRDTLEHTLRRLAKREVQVGIKRELDWQYLLHLYIEQKGQCALSGVPMTWIQGEGRIWTNISIDRIDSSRGYGDDNIQLVCRIINQMKTNLTVEEFINWCSLVGGKNANAL